MFSNTHYVGVVPLWLVEQLSLAQVPTEKAIDFEELSTILSVDDVCFYIHYLMKTHSYTDSMFSDMQLITKLPRNVDWIAANATAIEKAGVEFHRVYSKNEKNLFAEKTPDLVRKTAYSPVAVNDNVLLLTSLGEQGDSRSFLPDCVRELDKQVLFDVYRKFRIFKFYCMSE